MKNLAEADVRGMLDRVDGNVTWAASLLEVRRADLWIYIRRRAELLVFLGDLREKLVDDAEMFFLAMRWPIASLGRLVLFSRPSEKSVGMPSTREWRLSAMC